MHMWGNDKSGKEREKKSKNKISRNEKQSIKQFVCY